MPIKAIVVDLDNTLLHTNKKLSAYTVAVLKKCKENAINIMVATARPFRTASSYFGMVEFDGIAVSNGARVFCGNQKIEHGISVESAERLLSTLCGYSNLRITLETGECAYSNKPIEDYETVLTDNLAGVAKAEGALKILVHKDREGTLELVKKELPDDLYFTVSNGYLIQIMNKSATKWNGVKAMLEIGRCSDRETAYFGDDHDDIVPVKMCGMGVAVSNAIEEVKAVADYIAPSNDADGVARFIEQRILR